MQAAAREWDRAATGWNHHSALIHAWLNDATQLMLDAARIEQGARVLDIAAGTGDQTLEIAKRVGASGQVLATDIAPRFLAYALANARASGFAQVDTRVADAQSLNLKGANFDAAVCRLGLMFCSEPARALQEIYAALKPGGRFSAIVFGAPDQNPLAYLPFEIVRQHLASANQGDDATRPGGLMSLGDGARLVSLLRDSGFVHVRVTAISAPFRAISVTDYVDFLRASASPLIEMLAPLSIAIQNKAWEKIEDSLTKFSTAEGWIGPNELLLCEGQHPG
jgi:SAM-dependent methyltransferase